MLQLQPNICRLSLCMACASPRWGAGKAKRLFIHVLICHFFSSLLSHVHRERNRTYFFAVSNCGGRMQAPFHSRQLGALVEGGRQRWEVMCDGVLYPAVFVG